LPKRGQKSIHQTGFLFLGFVRGSLLEKVHQILFVTAEVREKGAWGPLKNGPES
jgi:hypothetical protein